MGTLHLHNKSDDTLPQPKELGKGSWETGYWYISEQRVEAMKGAVIHLHRHKSEPSFMAEIICGYHRRFYLDPRDGMKKLRTVFLFEENPSLKGAVTGSDGWLQSGIKWLP